MSHFYRPQTVKHDIYWMGIDKKEDLVRILFEYLVERMPQQARVDNWPIQESLVISRIILDNIVQGQWLSISFSQELDLNNFLTLDQLKSGVKMCIEVDLLGFRRLSFYNERSVAWRTSNNRDISETTPASERTEYYVTSEITDKKLEGVC